MEKIASTGTKRLKKYKGINQRSRVTRTLKTLCTQVNKEYISCVRVIDTLTLAVVGDMVQIIDAKNKKEKRFGRRKS